MARPIIHTIKHIVQIDNTAIAAGAISTIKIADAVANTALPTATSDVVQGAVIKAVWCEMWLKGNGASDEDTRFTAVIYKTPSDVTTPTIANMSNLMAWPNYKNILWTSQGVIGGVGGGQSVPIIRQWLKIPKGKQRMGLDDEINITVLALNTVIQHCGVFVFKENQ